MAAVLVAGAALVGWSGYDRLVRTTGGDPLAWRDVSAEVGSFAPERAAAKSFVTPTHVLRALHRLDPQHAHALPRIAWGREQLLVVALGPRSATGYDLRVLRVVDQRSRVLVVLQEQAPRLGRPATAKLVSPYRVIAIPNRHKPVHTTWLDRS